MQTHCFLSHEGGWRTSHPPEGSPDKRGNLSSWRLAVRAWRLAISSQRLAAHGWQAKRGATSENEHRLTVLF